jgi:hypothetical protein
MKKKNFLFVFIILHLSIYLPIVSADVNTGMVSKQFPNSLIPLAYVETVVNTSQQQQKQVGLFPWQDTGPCTYTYKSIRFQNSYSLIDTSGPTYTDASSSYGIYFRYKIHTYQYSYDGSMPDPNLTSSTLTHM